MNELHKVKEEENYKLNDQIQLQEAKNSLNDEYVK